MFWHVLQLLFYGLWSEINTDDNDDGDTVI